MRGILTAILCTTAVVAAPAAYADPLDHMTDAQKGKRLVQVLRTNGVPVTDTKNTILMAQTMCFSLRQGQPVPSVIADVSSTTGWDNRQAAMFYGAASAGWCPEFVPQ
jgi:hypothetical protein